MGEKFTAKNRVTFTQNRVAALPCKGGDRTYYYDTKAPGLCLCVTAAGGRTFYRLGRENGRTVRVLLGKFPALTVDDARQQALAVASDTAKGNDPQAEKLAKRHEQTIAGLWGWWLEWAKDHKRSWQGDEWLYNAYLKPWAGRKLSAIRQADVAALHAKIGSEHGKLFRQPDAVACSARCSTRAHNIGWKGDNPDQHVQRFKEEQRDRFLTADELPAFFDALNAEPNALLRDFFIVALLTGARRANVQAMRWDDLDLDAGFWRIPGSEAKAGMPLIVPLVEPAVKLLRERRTLTNGCPYVFPSHGKTRPYRRTQGGVEADIDPRRLGGRADPRLAADAGKLAGPGRRKPTNDRQDPGAHAVAHDADLRPADGRSGQGERGQGHHGDPGRRGEEDAERAGRPAGREGRAPGGHRRGSEGRMTQFAGAAG